MRRRLSIIGAGMFLAACALCLAADPGTISEARRVQGPVVKTVITWNSNTNSDGMTALTDQYYRGELRRVVIGATSVTGEAYVVSLTDEQGVDLLAGLGSATSNAVVDVAPAQVTVVGGNSNVVPYVINDRLLIGVTNIPVNTSGTITLFIR